MSYSVLTTVPQAIEGAQNHALPLEGAYPLALESFQLKHKVRGHLLKQTESWGGLVKSGGVVCVVWWERDWGRWHSNRHSSLVQEKNPCS